MPNTIKYNTSSESNALSIGNMHMGVGDVGKGPTESTGFYNGINPPNGGYTIYIHKTTGGPSILRPISDAELIDITNGIAEESYTTINECFNYFAGQDDKIVMNNPITSIISNELRFAIDSRILPSYPHNGTTLYDLSGYTNNWTSLSNVSFNNQVFDFNGTNSYMQGSVSSFNPDSAPNVMEVLFKPMKLNSSQQAIFSDNWGPEYGIWIYSNNTLRGAAYTNVSSNTLEVGRWYYAVLNVQPGANKSSTDQTYIQFYVNGDYMGAANANTGNGMNDQPFSLGFDYKGGSPANHFSGSIASARLSYGQYDQSDVNFNYYGGNIVTDGLVFAADPGNLVSYESGSTTAYSLTGSISGTLNNGVGFDGSNGGVFEFDGVDDGIKFETGMNFSGNSAITITGWLYVTGGGSWDRWFSGATGTNYHHPDLAILANGDIGFYFSNLNTGWRDTNQSIGLNTWALVSYVFKNDGKVKIYIDDEIVYNNTFSSGTLPTDYNFMLGNRYDYNGEAIVGKIGPVSIYNRQLTAEEISQNYKANVNRFN